jgi:hypothetical protein
MAEAAVERATDLAGDAQGAPVSIGDEDHLVILAVIGAQQPFARAVARYLRLDDLGPADDEALGEPGAHRLGDIGHCVEIGDAAMVNPVEQLFGAQLGLLAVEPGSIE